MRWPKPTQCEVVGCNRPREAKGMCRLHYSERYRRRKYECQRNGSVTAATENVLPLPTWEWLGDEAELAERVEREESKGART